MLSSNYAIGQKKFSSLNSSPPNIYAKPERNEHGLNSTGKLKQLEAKKKTRLLTNLLVFFEFSIAYFKFLY